MANGEFLSVVVRNPRTHLRGRWPQFTDYEILIWTNSTCFVSSKSCVRRRFSEFEWLRNILEQNGSISLQPPPLPHKRLLGRFNQSFIKERQQELQDFLVRVLAVTSYLSEAALHLFLQTNLSINTIERILDGRDTREVADVIADECHKGVADQDDLGLHKIQFAGRFCSRSCKETERKSDSGFSSASCDYRSHSASCSSIHSNTSPLKSRFDWPTTTSASKLPTGQLIAADEHPSPAVQPALSSDCSSHCGEEKCKRCFNYDADDEIDVDTTGYNIMNNSTNKVMKWLSAMTESGDYNEEEISAQPEPTTPFCYIPEYDVISVPCLKRSLPLAITASTSTGYDSNDMDDSLCSEYSVVHSTLGGLQLINSSDDDDSLSSSLRSVGVYRTYDVIEMIEVR